MTADQWVILMLCAGNVLVIVLHEWERSIWKRRRLAQDAYIKSLRDLNDACMEAYSTDFVSRPRVHAKILKLVEDDKDRGRN